MPPDISTRRLLEQLAAEDGRAFTLGDLLQRFRARAFGAFLLIALLPSFLPLPVGVGAISGPLVCLIGLQLLAQRARPWLPRALARRPLSAQGLAKLQKRSERALAWLERYSRPRWEAVIDHPGARVFCGLLLIALGVLLALPIPLTNWPFGAILLLFAIALIERDGVLMLIGWGLGLLEIGAVLLFWRQLSAWAGTLFA